MGGFGNKKSYTCTARALTSEGSYLPTVQNNTYSTEEELNTMLGKLCLHTPVEMEAVFKRAYRLIISPHEMNGGTFEGFTECYGRCNVLVGVTLRTALSNTSRIAILHS